MFFTIKFMMTTAMLFYSIAFWTGSKRYKATHIVLASSGFALDLYATYLMETIRITSGLKFTIFPPVLKFHTIISIVAIAAFLLQMFLGIYHKPKWHVWSAKYLFLPSWVIAYLSGIYIIW